MKQIRKQTCVDCHFLAISHTYNPASGNYIHNVLGREHRDDLRKGNPLHANITLACDWGEWGEHDPDGVPVRSDELTKDRRNLCFFWTYQPGIRLETAKIKQQRAEDREKILETRRLSIFAIFIAGIGLFCNVAQFVFKIAEFVLGILGAIPKS